MKRLLALTMILLLLITGCTNASPNAAETESVSEPLIEIQPEATVSELDPIQVEPVASEAGVESTGQRYIDQVVEEVMAGIVESGMSELEITKACFDYLIETVYFTWPIAMDVWRIRDNSGIDEPYTFVENRALSPLLFGLGNCEDYASALVLMLNSVGIEAKYMPGLTYTREGVLVGHAWTIAKVDGIWYHLDAELEDGITQNNTVRYQYFLKSDATMSVSHRFGQNLIDAGLLTEEQNEIIREQFFYDPCPEDHPTLEPTVVTPTPRMDADAILAEIEEEWREYESLYGALEEMEIDTTPPLYPNGYYIGRNLSRGNGPRESTW